MLLGEDARLVGDLSAENVENEWLLEESFVDPSRLEVVPGAGMG